VLSICICRYRTLLTQMSSSYNGVLGEIASLVNPPAYLFPEC
jgi:hypothetical protein